MGLRLPTLIPTKRFVGLAFVSTGMAIAAGLLSGMDPAWIGLDALLLVLAGVDALQGRRRCIHAERHAPEIFSIGRANGVTLVLHNRSDRTLVGTVMDDPMDDAESSGLPGHFRLPPHGRAQLRYELTPTRRGKRRLDGLTVRYALPLGLFERQERIEQPQEVDVYPDIHAARELEMLRRRGGDEVRAGSLRVRGGDTEFERLRPYQGGDEMRHVDWRSSARRDDLVSRQYQAESNQNVVFALDIGRGMRGESDGITSIDHALRAALLTADVAIRGGDRAGLLTFDDRPRAFLRPTGGRTGARKLTRAVYALDADFAATDYRAAMVFLKTQVKARSLFVLFTNPIDPRSAKELASAVRSLMPRHLPLCVLMRDVAIERLALGREATADALVRGAAAEALNFRDEIVRQLKNEGALVLDAQPNEVTPLLVKRYLEVKARRLL